MTMENKKSGLGAAGTMENYTANIVHNFGTSKHGAENVINLGQTTFRLGMC